MKRRRDGKKKVERVTASVSVNEVDHPQLYSAIVNGDVEIGYFPSISSFLAGAGEKELSRLSDERITMAELSNRLQLILDIVEDMKKSGLGIVENSDDDEFGELRNLFEVTS